MAKEVLARLIRTKERILASRATSAGMRGEMSNPKSAPATQCHQQASNRSFPFPRLITYPPTRHTGLPTLVCIPCISPESREQSMQSMEPTVHVGYM